MLTTHAPAKFHLAPPPGPTRRRVLLSANAVSPARGSEPGVGWHLASRLARHHDITVLCASQVPPNAQPFRQEIEAHLSQHGPIAGLEFCFVDPPLASYCFQRESMLMRRTLYYVGYRAWQKAAYRHARRLHAQRPFDLVHHLNITCFREPGYLWRLPAPFVWGPIGGAADLPAEFLPLMGWQERMFYRARNLGNAWQRRMSRRCRLAAGAAKHIWAIGEAEQRLTATAWGRTAQGMIETGALGRDGVRAKSLDPSRPLRLIWSGQHIGRKALNILLHALAALPRELRIELTVLGDGPETGRWKALAAQKGLEPNIRWVGQVSHAAALEAMGRADALAFTSLQEGTPHVVLEALSLGLPVICHDACGMGQAVTPASGIKIPLRDPQTSIDGFAAAIVRLATERQLLGALSQGAIDRAGELTWDAKAQQIAAVYDEILQPVARGGGKA